MPASKKSLINPVHEMHLKNLENEMLRDYNLLPKKPQKEPAIFLKAKGHLAEINDLLEKSFRQDSVSIGLAKQHEADLSSALKKYHKVANKFPKFSGKLLTKINKIRNLSSAEKVLEQFDGLRSRYGKYRKEAGDPLNHASSDIKEIADRIQTFKKSLEKAKKAKVDN